MLTDPKTRAIASIDKTASTESEIKYVTYQLPNDYISRKAGQYVYRNGNTYRYQDTGRKVDKKKISSLIKRPLETVVLNPKPKHVSLRKGI